jgi:ATP-dependent DNA helicase DinG
MAEPLEGRLKDARSVLEQGLPLIRSICEEVDPSDYSPKHQFQCGEVGAELEAIAKDAAQCFTNLVVLLEKLHDEIDTLVSDEAKVAPEKELDAMLALLGNWLGRAEANMSLWQSYRDTAFDLNKPFARWISLVASGDDTDFELVSSPVLASGILNSGLWSRCCGAVVTSATMRALNSFDRFKLRSGLYEQAEFDAVLSPFDFENNAVLSVPSDAVEANKSFEHTQSLATLLPDILDLDEASLVLFSSHAQMNQVYEAMPDELQDIILVQGNHSKQKIIELHKRRVDRFQGSIIWGLASFAEGVDLPGDYCKHVVIAKLPFSVPDEPLEAAYAEWIKERGGNAFMEVTVPDASIRLIQACGRLLRTEKDTGRVSILDKRLISKRYGSAILNSLPPFKREFDTASR